MPNFNALPPEVNVSNIRGPGSGPMWTAQKAWDDLEAELLSAAEKWSTQLQAVELVFYGAAANKFMEAAVLYTQWLQTHAGTADEISDFLEQAASAYEDAVTSMVPTASIVANRAAALTLRTTNLFGQFTTIIAELDDQYQRAWTINAEAMNTYQSVSFDIMARAENTRIVPAPMVVHHPSKPFGDSHTTTFFTEGKW